MKVHQVISCLELLAPLAYSEDFDNTGLLVGSKQAKVSGILVAHDLLEEVVDEAIELGCNLVVGFHPIIFSGLKRLNGSTYVERAVMKAIKHDIALFAVHTALDNAWNGVNAGMCKAIGLGQREILIPRQGSIQKLQTYVPHANLEEVRKALFDAGAGHIGNYSHCSFGVEGTGTYQAEEGANPTLGQQGQLHREAETLLSLIFPTHLKQNVINALKVAHPYEEVAYEVIDLVNDNRQLGMGMTGLLEEPLDEKSFLGHLRTVFGTPVLRHSAFTGNKIRKVGVLGGSGSFAIGAAMNSGVDAFVTADLKYHDFYRGEGKILLVDVGHYESEQFTTQLLVDHLNEKITTFAPALPESGIRHSKVKTNPISYY
jgi:dinuclear metal center YbgI/SA1388 family protein